MARAGHNIIIKIDLVSDLKLNVAVEQIIWAQQKYGVAIWLCGGAAMRWVCLGQYLFA